MILKVIYRGIHGAWLGAIGLSLFKYLLSWLFDADALRHALSVVVGLGFAMLFGALLGSAAAIVTGESTSGYRSRFGWGAIIWGAAVLLLAICILLIFSRGRGVGEFFNGLLAPEIGLSCLWAARLPVWGALHVRRAVKLH